MTNKSIFNKGDLVKLKSGGPDMAVCDVNINPMTEEFVGTYRCQWFAGEKLELGIFPQESLIAATTEA